MRLAKLLNGVVVDIIIANSLADFRDYVVCNDWIRIGDSIDTPEPFQVTPVPVVVTMRQARLALLQQGVLAQVRDTIATLPGPEGEAARIEWEYSTTVDRNSPLVASIINILALSPTQVKELFILAGSL